MVRPARAEASAALSSEASRTGAPEPLGSAAQHAAAPTARIEAVHSKAPILVVFTAAILVAMGQYTDPALHALAGEWNTHRPGPPAVVAERAGPPGRSSDEAVARRSVRQLVRVHPEQGDRVAG